MFKNILVPLDGSADAERALPFAQALATRTSACVTLVRATHIAPTLRDRAPAQLQVTHTAEDYLRGLAAELEAHSLRVQTGVPYGGSTSEWIAEEVGMRGADLVVMATHDRTGPDRWLHGSVSESVVGKLTIPVLLIRAAENQALQQRFEDTPPVIVVPLDGSELAAAALPIALEMANTLGGHVVLVSVVPLPGQLVAGKGGAIATFDGPQHAQLVEDAHTYLDQIVARLVADGTSTEAAVRLGEAAASIADVAHELNAAVIVMATHGRSGLIRTILGSVAGKVVHRASTPVLLIHASPRAQRSAAGSSDANPYASTGVRSVATGATRQRVGSPC